MRLLRRCFVVGALALAVSGTVAAQGQVVAQVGSGGQPQQGRIVVANATEANETRQQLRELMRKYPPSLGQVLRLDPTLLTNDNYLQTYPELRAYLRQHPEVPRAPDYYLSFANLPFDFQPPTPDQFVWNRIQEIMAVTAVMISATLAAILLLWLIRHLLAHRRWLRATKMQADLQNKLIERLTTSDDVRSFLQAIPASKFLADVPAMAEGSRGALPATRILRSVQVGVTSLVAGLSVIVAGSTVGEEVIALVGGLGVAIGLGFLAAAAASYVVSKRLGLLPTSDAVADDRV
jgi:ABC-type multidrug transport system fused ATPase/permease subunit